MAKKQRKIEHTKHVTRRQLSRKEREQKTNRLVLIVVGIVILAAVVFGGYGVYATAIQPMQATVLDINGTKIDMNYYLTLLKLYVVQSSDPQGLLAESQFSSAVLGDIEKNLVLIQGAPKLGYTMGEQEIKDALSAAKLPDEQVYRDVFTGQALQQKLLDHFGKQIPASTEQVKVQALVVESKQVAENITGLFNKGETFTILAKTYGVEKLTKEKGGELGWLPKGLVDKVLGISDASILENNAFNLKAGEISKPIYDKDIVKGTGYWIIKVEEKDGDASLHMRVILVGTLEEANDVKQKLDAGADFATLAKQVSQHASKDDGGDKGWVNKYTQDPDLTFIIETAFGMQANSVSEPVHDIAIETTGGYWVIRVVEKETNRPIDKEVRDSLVQAELGKWLEDQGQKSKIQELITEEQKTWAINKVKKDLKVKS